MVTWKVKCAEITGGKRKKEKQAMRQGVGGGDVEGGVNKSALSDENPL